MTPCVDGERLRPRLARERQLAIDDAATIADQVASALDYAQRQAGVIHREVKLEKILRRDGEAMIADFGIGLAVSNVGARLKETGLSLGTPHYMSPEPATGDRELDRRTDIHALGAVMSEMLIRSRIRAVKDRR